MNKQIVLRGIRFGQSWCFSLLCFLFVFSTSVYGEINQSAECSLSVRLIKGASADVQPVAATKFFEEGLKDISKQLSSLPFSSYSLLDQSDRPVGLGLSTEVYLRYSEESLHRFVIKPRRAVDSKLELGFRWFDHHGEELVASEMWLVKRQPVLFGADTEQYQSAIAAFVVDCP